MNKLLITLRENKILTALWDGTRVLQFQAEDPDSGLRVGDVYVGRVTSYVKNIHAAFIETAPGITCFYQLRRDETVKIGQEFPVKITREAVKTKMAVCSRDISLTGRYLVLVSDRTGLMFSSKLAPAKKMMLAERMQELPARHGVGYILRTNAGACDPEILLAEAESLAESYHHLMDVASHRPHGTRLIAGIPAYLSLLQDAPSGSIEEIVTDIPEIHEEIDTYLQTLPSEDRTPLRRYTDDAYSMSKLYRLEHFLAEALGRRVWLPSGGYLVIDPTEALTVIDVNTGRYSGHKKKEEAFLKIDLEACDAITAQMQLRNLSGIILVDFIDLEEETHREQLYSYLKDCLAKDTVKSVLVDITPLHLAEITRKKIRPTLSEQLKGRPAEEAEDIQNSYKK